MASYSPLDEWRKSAFGSFFAIPEYWWQRKRILAKPELVFSDPHKELSIKPLAFALRGLFLLAAVFALLNWVATNIVTLPPTADERAIARSRVLEEKIRDKSLSITDYLEAQTTAPSKSLENLRKLQSFAETVRALLIPIGLTVAAYLFRRLLRRYNDLAPETDDADKAYLYWISSKLFFPNLAIFMVLESTTFRSRFMDAEVSRIISLWLVIIFSLWAVFALRRASPELGKLLGLSDAIDEKSGIRIVANRLVVANAITNIVIQVAFTGLLLLYGTLMFRGDA